MEPGCEALRAALRVVDCCCPYHGTSVNVLRQPAQSLCIECCQKFNIRVVVLNDTIHLSKDRDLSV